MYTVSFLIPLHNLVGSTSSYHTINILLSCQHSRWIFKERLEKTLLCPLPRWQISVLWEGWRRTQWWKTQHKTWLSKDWLWLWGRERYTAESLRLSKLLVQRQNHPKNSLLVSWHRARCKVNIYNIWVTVIVGRKQWQCEGRHGVLALPPSPSSTPNLWLKCQNWYILVTIYELKMHFK